MVGVRGGEGLGLDFEDAFREDILVRQGWYVVEIINIYLPTQLST